MFTSQELRDEALRLVQLDQDGLAVESVALALRIGDGSSNANELDWYCDRHDTRNPIIDHNELGIDESRQQCKEQIERFMLKDRQRGRVHSSRGLHTNCRFVRFTHAIAPVEDCTLGCTSMWAMSTRALAA